MNTKESFITEVIQTLDKYNAKNKAGKFIIQGVTIHIADNKNIFVPNPHCLPNFNADAIKI